MFLSAKIWRLAAALFSVGLFAFLALRSSPWLSELGWMPDWLSAWADRNGNFRNFPAFALLAVILGCCSSWRLGTFFTAVLGIGFELIQLWLPARFFDWEDIGWSVAGACVGGGLVRQARLWNRRGGRSTD